jgi:hypothetical protein
VTSRKPDFFLASGDGYNLEEPRKAYVIRRYPAAKRDDYLLVRIDPPYESHGYVSEKLVLAAKFEGTSLFPISYWPLPVYVLRPLVQAPDTFDTLDPDREMELIAWAEIYRTMDEVQHSLDE